MFNTIKKINMESIFENLCEKYLGKEGTQQQEDEIEKLCVNLEENEEFKKLFFFIEADHHNYFYEFKNEEIVKDYLTKSFQPYNIEKEIVYYTEYREELIELCDSYKDIEFKFTGTKTTIGELYFYQSLGDEFLNEETYIKRLVDAENFYDELEVIKKECLKYLFEMSIDEIKTQLENYKF